MIGIDILDMDGACGAVPYPHAGAQVHRLMRNAVLAGEAAIRPMRITDEEHLPVEPGQQVTLQLRCRQRAAPDDCIDGLSAAVARDQDAVEFA